MSPNGSSALTGWAFTGAKGHKLKRFWSSVIHPILQSAKARHIVEVGAFQGANTAKLARWAAENGARFDCIDPVPDFDTATLDVAGQMHRALSLDVLADLMPADLVLVDGDHNWHTVFHEMQILYGENGPIAETAPIAICHDVGWPYGRRDMYYAPETVPAQHPSLSQGISPYDRGLTPYGINQTFHNATQEGGPRNGVRTAIEDALHLRQDQVDILWLDGLFGLAVIVPKARLRANPRLAETLARITPTPEIRQMLRLLEKERIDGLLAAGQLARLTGTEISRPDPARTRSFDSAISQDLLGTLQAGMLKQSYRGRAIMLNPFDMANMLQLLQQVRPGTVFEIGTAEGGRALWMADTLQALGCQPQIVAVDIIEPRAFDDPRITFFQGDAAKLADLFAPDFLANLPRPWIVIEDAAHFGDLTAAVVQFFDPMLQSGDWLLIEDGILNQFTGHSSSAISDFVAGFLQARGHTYKVATEYCDRFGYNVTSNPNGWLKRA